MQNKIHRVLSLLLVVIMVLSMIPAALAAENSASAVYAAENTTTGAQYADVNEAIAAAQAGQIVKVLADAENVAYGNAGVILDLNGCNLTNVIVAEGVTLTAIDSATDDYEGAYGSLTTEGDVAATVKTAEPKSYVAISDNGSYSFHRYYASIAAISLQPSKVSLGYRAEFRGDEAVKNAVVSYGYELWVNNNAHKTYSRTDALERSSLTLRLSNILREGNDALNAMGSTATIGGNAYITLDLGNEQVTLYGTQQETTLRQVVEAVNASAGSFGEAQLAAVREMCTTYAAWMMGWATENIFGSGEGTEGDGLKVEIVVDVNAENNILSQDATMSYGDITATVPQGAVLENGVKQLVLTITEKAESDSDVTEGEGETLIPLDVHISGISADNTAPIVICLGDILPKGLNIGNYDLFHVENGKTVPMSRVYTVSELDAHNEFYYDPATGSVTVAMASFSEIALRSANIGTWDGGVDHEWYNTTDSTLYIYNADQLWSFSQIVGGMAEGIEQDSFAGKTVVLYADINLDDVEGDSKIFYPIGYYNSDGTYEKTGTAISSAFKAFAGTFDGNGHTISNFYQNTWEMKGDHNWYAPEDQHYRDGMGLFGKVYGGTIKNLTVKNFSSDGEIATTGTIAAYADCGATFENISIFNCNPRVYNIGNGGIVGCVGWYAKEANTKVTFKNITVDNTNKITSLWGSWDTACGGLVGQYYPTSGQSSADYPVNGGIHMDNCHITAQIDVFNDVCANYQYYAYRYAGILIGSVRENVTIDGREYPDMTGITAEDCTVGFGDWNDYYYCELVANSQASYTHDYQMSRLTQVDEITDEMKAGTGNYVIVNGEHGTENAKCYHFVNGVEHKHEDEGTEVVDGKTVLKEDKQHIYLEFNNLVTGYGWGVTSKGVNDMDGVTILDKNAVQKFEAYVGAQTTMYSGASVTLGNLFYEQRGSVKSETVKAFVSPVGEGSTVTATYTVVDANDWTKNTLTFYGKGAAEIIITDYYFCHATTLDVNVEEYTVSFAVPDGVAEVEPIVGVSIDLPTANDYSADGVDYTFEGWIEAPMTDASQDKPEVLESPYTASKNTLLYPVYSYSENTSGETTWNLVTDINSLIVGDEVIIASNANNKVAGYDSSNTKYLTAITATFSSDKSTLTNYTSDPVVLTLGGESGQWTLSYNGKKLGSSSDLSWDSNTTTWNISISNNNATIASTSNANNKLQYNSGSPRFKTYTSSQAAIQLYKKAASSTATTMYDSFVEACTHNYVDGICTICSAIEPSPYVATEIGQISAQQNVIITMTGENGTTYALYNGNGASAAPTAVVVELEDGKITTADNSILWNIVNNSGELTIYPAGTTATWLYCNNANNGVRVGTGEDNIFVIDDTYGYLFNNGQDRYIGIYEAQDWRSYTTTPTDNNIKNQTLAFYVQKVNCAHINKIDVEAVAPGCENPGYTACQQCADCGNYFGREEIAALGHTEVIDAAVAATCINTGLTEGSHCSVCNEVLVAQETVAATGEHIFVDGACTTDGCDATQSAEPADKIYVLVTDIADITDGEYIIVGNGKALPTTIASKMPGTVVEIANNTITATNDTPVWTITGNSSSFTLSNGTNYLKYSSSTNLGSSDTAYNWKLEEVDNVANTFKVISTDTSRGLVYRAKTYNQFGGYAISNVTSTSTEYYGIQFYKLSDHSEGGGTTPTEPEKLATFEFGANGTASTDNGNTSTTYTETVDNHTLSISNGTKMYTKCYDAGGNSCLKIGTSSATGSFTITVPENVTHIALYVAKYKSDTGSIKINGTTYSLKSSSATPAYDYIVIEVPASRTITVASTSKRIMINTIEFWNGDPSNS